MDKRPLKYFVNKMKSHIKTFIENESENRQMYVDLVKIFDPKKKESTIQRNWYRLKKRKAKKNQKNLVMEGISIYKVVKIKDLEYYGKLDFEHLVREGGLDKIELHQFLDNNKWLVEEGHVVLPEIWQLDI